MEKILNKRKVRGVVKYLVQWKKSTAGHDTWEREENLENVKKVVAEFEERVNTEVRQQKKLDMTEKRDFRRGELPGKYTAKMLYRWDCQNCEQWTWFHLISFFFSFLIFFYWFHFTFLNFRLRQKCGMMSQSHNHVT